MTIRPTRSLAILLAVLIVFSTVSLLDNRLKTYSRNRFSIITAPSHYASPPPPDIVEFWAQFAHLLDNSKPNVNPIQLTHSLEGQLVEGSEEANGERKPFQQSIGISPQDVKALSASHLKLTTDTRFEHANEHAAKLYRGTGIVTVAGGPYFPPVLIAIEMLRKQTNSTLPVHVFLQNKKEYEPYICEEVLPTLNAQCFVIEDYLRKSNPFEVQSYQLKIMAILFSRFENVLFLDSDCMALRDPRELFSSEPYLSTGFLSWSDYWIATEDPVFYNIAGLPKMPSGMPTRSSETGQLMVNKRKHLTTLLLAAYYNVFGPDFYYPLMSQGAMGEGDKETFLAGAAVLGNPYYRIKENCGTIGYHDPQGNFHGGAIVQYHAGDDWILAHGNASQKATTQHNKPRPFFLHANYPKMNVAFLLDENHIFLEGTEQRIRIWGDQKSIVEMFGYDIEKTVWDLLRHQACEMGDKMGALRGRWQICKRANEHYKEIFDSNTAFVPIGGKAKEGKKGA